MRFVIQPPRGADDKPGLRPPCQGSALDPQPPFGASLLTADPSGLLDSAAERRLSARCNLRLTPGELARLRDDAEAAGLSLSELVRRRYFGRPVVHRDQALLASELRRLGGLLKHLHGESGGAQSARSGHVLDLIGQTLRAGLAPRKDAA